MAWGFRAQQPRMAGLEGPSRSDPGLLASWMALSPAREYPLTGLERLSQAEFRLPAALAALPVTGC